MTTSSVHAQLENTLAGIAALGPRHAKYVEKYLRPQAASRLDELLRRYPDLDFASPTPDLYAFILKLSPHKSIAGYGARRVKWLRPYLAEAAGLRNFDQASARLGGKLRRAYPLIWQALAADPGFTVGPSVQLLRVAGSVSAEELGEAGKALGQAKPLNSKPATLKLVENLITLPGQTSGPAGATEYQGLYDYLGHQIQIALPDLTLQSLLICHPLSPGVPLPLLLGLEPCLRRYLFLSPVNTYQYPPLHILLHECLHAFEPRREEEYQPAIHGQFDLGNPNLEIHQVVYGPLGWRLAAFDRQSLENSYLQISPVSLTELGEGVIDRLTDLRLPAIAQAVVDPDLARPPAWPAELLTLVPPLRQFHYTSQCLINSLGVHKVYALMTLGFVGLKTVLDPLIKRLLLPIQAEALNYWLRQPEPLILAAIANKTLTPSPELKELLSGGWEVVARWLALPAYCSPAAQYWNGVKVGEEKE